MPAGYYSLENTDVSTMDAQPFITTPCPVGTYCPPGSFAPVNCPAGTFRNNLYGTDNTSCGKCPAGTYCPDEGMSVPTVCDQGSFCPEGSQRTQPCPRGTYGADPGLYDSRGCTECTAGYYCPFLGQTAVDTTNHICDKGYYCEGGAYRPEPTDDTTGNRCPAGRYCPAGTGSPENCPKGEYGPYVGANDSSECVDCKPGFYCLGEDSTDATSQCKAGYYCIGKTVSFDDYDPASPEYRTDGVYSGIAQAGYYAPTGSS